MKIIKAGLKKPTRAKKTNSTQEDSVVIDRFDIGMDVPISDEREMSLNPSNSIVNKHTSQPVVKEPTVPSGVGRTLPSGVTVHPEFDNVNPSRVRVWQENTRYGVIEDTQALEADIRATGRNHTPVLLRPLKDNDEFDFELIYGTRRLTSCINTGKLLYSEIFEISDADAFILMLSENNRKDPSEWKVIKSYHHGLEKGFFANQQALANHVGIKREYINKLFSALDMPPFFYELLDKNLPNASRKVIIDFGLTWRQGFKQSQMDIEQALELLKSAVDKALHNKIKLDKQTAFNIVKSVFNFERPKANVIPYNINDAQVKILVSNGGSLTISVPKQAGEQFINGIQAYIEEQSTLS